MENVTNSGQPQVEDAPISRAAKTVTYLKEYETLGAKPELSGADEVRYAVLSDLLARCHVCVGVTIN